MKKMKRVVKKPLERKQGGTVAMLLGMVCVVFFAAAGCGKQKEPSPEPDICDYISGKASVSEKIIEDVTINSYGDTSLIVRIDGTLYSVYRGVFFRVNTEVVSVKLKPDIENLPEDLIVILSLPVHRIFNLSVPETVDVVDFVFSLRQRNIFEHVQINSFGYFSSDNCK